MLTTILHRPYVFAFLAAFLVLGRIYWGWRKTFLWLVIGYLVAWISEFSSINNGFPYGLYHYIYKNMPGELMIFGVPFWDSLSYPFMIFAGYTTAEFILRASPPQTDESRSNCQQIGSRLHSNNNLTTALLGAFLTMLLDIIIDPLTVLGDRWFLGNIYYYPNGGQYFGVPITNFAGWFLVPLAVIFLFQFFTNNMKIPKYQNTNTLKHFLNPLFYLSIAIFNIIITIWINEPLLASIDCFILIPVVLAIICRIKQPHHRTTELIKACSPYTPHHRMKGSLEHPL